MVSQKKNSPFRCNYDSSLKLKNKYALFHYFYYYSLFQFIEVNGLRLTEPRQVYVRIWKGLTGKKVSSDQAQQCLENKFSSENECSTILLVDEV